MKTYFILIVLFSTTTIFLHRKSQDTLRELSKIVDFSESSRELLLANNHLSRAQSFTANSFALNEKSFAHQAEKFLQVAISQSKNIDDPKIKLKLEKLLFKLKMHRQKLGQGSPALQSELLGLIGNFENLGLEIMKVENKHYGPQFRSFKNLLESYDSLNKGVFIFFFFSVISLSAVFLLELKRRRFLKQLSSAEKIQGMLFSALSESIFYVDSHGKIMTCNPSAAALSGVDIRELIGKSIYTIFEGAQIVSKRGIRQRTLEELIQTGSDLKDITLYQEKNNDEKRWFKLSSQPVLSGDKKDSFSLIISVYDITEQVEARHTIEQQHQKLVESSKMQTIGELAGGIAHEINNPLAIISGSTEMLEFSAERNKSIPVEEVKEQTTKIFSTIDRIGKTVRGLLKMSRGEVEKFVPTQVEEILNMTEEFCHNLLAKNDVKLEISEKNRDLKIDCHPTQLSQVLINLVKNAIDAILNEKERWIKIESEVEKEHLVIKVTDSGKGIPKKIADKILLPFFTTKEIGKGTGLGLSISRTIIEEHQGTITIDQKNPHTCFVIKIPIKQDRENTIENYDEMIKELNGDLKKTA